MKEELREAQGNKCNKARVRAKPQKTSTGHTSQRGAMRHLKKGQSSKARRRKKRIVVGRMHRNTE